ncbi:RNA polymerase factor sigma-54 [Pontivivens insulae]|uniref:RNA polymerase sigma-54 factor n=1 Tax=Pontivivens insulae TaxID=1639689 RepID=A0A2R8A858_9RHOB|nr:RNA polymerase factor sigma-54 [Pontivivens insulae]RED18488.1 RNA polymerase RpoN-/SigL-like sigma 54 subunit [Pontivivens insulae]SPF28386.1 RNA polymerase sigma-54 factor 1 [Pontivivens insulae]
MALTQRLDLTQTQQLRLTPQLRQAIALLQMSNVDLTAKLAEEVEKNPLLTLERPRALPGGLRSGGEDFDKAALVEQKPSLRMHLLAQIGVMKAKPRILALARVLVDELDADGRMTTPPFEVADRYGVVAGQVHAALALVQACEPTGIGARSLRECLKLQLVEKGLLSADHEAVCDGLKRIAGPERAGFLEEHGISEGRLAEVLRDLRGLDPRPGRAFTTDEPPLAAPDVFIRRAGAGWRVELNSDTLPRILMNDTYASELTAMGQEAARFVSRCRASAGWLTKALEQRAETILKVGEALIRRQSAYFEHGVEALRPLTMAELAEDIGMHESTVSRIAANKFLESPQGMRELRWFFSQGVGGTDGASSFAAGAVQARLRTMIESEPAHRTLSDDKLVQMLRESGVDVARRTVAKYREAMGIPSSVQRRRIKAASRP